MLIKLDKKAPKKLTKLKKKESEGGGPLFPQADIVLEQSMSEEDGVKASDAAAKPSGSGEAKKPKGPRVRKAKDVEARKRRLSPQVKDKMPLVASNVNRKVVLVQADDGRIDLSGDSGSIGRCRVSDDGKKIQLDLKGMQHNLRD